MGNFALIDFGEFGPAIIEQLQTKGHMCPFVISESIFEPLYKYVKTSFIEVENLFSFSIVVFDEQKLAFFRQNYDWFRRSSQRWIVGEQNHDDYFFQTFRTFCFFCEKLEQEKIEVAFSGINSPHHLYNHLFYIATVYYGIKHYFLSHIFINNRVNIVEGLQRKIWSTDNKFTDHAEIYNYVKHALGKTTRPKYVADIHNKRKNPLGHMKLLANAYSLAKTCKSLASFVIKRNRMQGICLFPLNKSYSFFYSLKCWRSRKRIGKLKRVYHKLAIEDLPKKFVLVLGPYQPEAPTLPDAEGYADVRLMLLHLRTKIPNDMAIVYKEHPSIFLFRIEGFDSTIDDHRSESFYSDIVSMGIKLSINTADFGELVDRAEFVVGITGTFAIEAALRGKQAFTYGNHWFGGIPFVTRINYDSSLETNQKFDGENPQLQVTNHLCWINANSLPNILGTGTRIRQQGDIQTFCHEYDRIMNACL